MILDMYWLNVNYIRFSQGKNLYMKWFVDIDRLSFKNTLPPFLFLASRIQATTEF